MEYIAEEQYQNLELILPEAIFGYVYDINLGPGVYLGFDPIGGYTYDFQNEICHGIGHKPMTTIIAIQSTPFTLEQLDELHNKTIIS